MLKTGNTLAISEISLIHAPCKVLNIRIMRTFNYNDMPHEVLEMASEYAIKESRSGRGLSHSQAMEKIKIMVIAHYKQSTVTVAKMINRFIEHHTK